MVRANIGCRFPAATPPARREGFAFSGTAPNSLAATPPSCRQANALLFLCDMLGTFMVSPDTPAYYLTSVPRDRLPVFRTDPIKTLTCDALDEARKSGKFLLLAYVIMPDHLHLVAAGDPKPSEILRYANGIS
ncbi:MAG: transposase, partial [Blastocatellia bacterium]